MPRARMLSLALMACLGLPGVVWAQAQATTGAIQGLVTDPSGAVTWGPRSRKVAARAPDPLAPTVLFWNSR